MTNQRVFGHCHGVLASTGSAIVLDIFGGLTPSDFAKPPCRKAG
jgi:hypothetical protein